MRVLKVALLVCLVAAVAAVAMLPLLAGGSRHTAAVLIQFALLGGMAITVKSGDAIAKKYIARAGAAGQDYQNGVNNPRRPWQASTSAAAETYAQGVQAAVSNGSFAKGVGKAGDAKWARKSSGVGAQRYGPGVTAAAPDYQAGVQPYLDTIASLTLPPRQPKGSPGNIARVSAIADALRAKKLRG